MDSLRQMKPRWQCCSTQSNSSGNNTLCTQRWLIVALVQFVIGGIGFTGDPVFCWIKTILCCVTVWRVDSCCQPAGEERRELNPVICCSRFLDTVHNNTLTMDTCWGILLFPRWELEARGDFWSNSLGRKLFVCPWVGWCLRFETTVYLCYENETLQTGARKRTLTGPTWQGPSLGTHYQPRAKWLIGVIGCVRCPCSELTLQA